MNRKIIVVDFTDCKTIWDFHQRIKKAFHFPDFYGQNWDAFWDLLSEPRENTLIKVRGTHTVAKELDSSVKKLIEILKDNKEYQYRWQCDCDFVIED